MLDYALYYDYCFDNISHSNDFLSHSQDFLSHSQDFLSHSNDFIDILKKNDNDQILIYSNLFKLNINNYIRNSKFNIKNIIKFIKYNIKDITEQEINNMVVSFEFLNKFGI